MFRLIKLIAYSAIGYFLYQMWQGMRDTESGGGGGNEGEAKPGRGPQRSRGAGQGRIANFTGTGQGRPVNTADERSGMSVPHVVGRGVVSR